MREPEPVPPEVLAYYARGREAARLGEGHGVIERERTRELITRWLPPPPARILDVGGGPGGHAAWLAAEGYAVSLVDPVPLHVAQALDAAARAGVALAWAREGDARRLDLPDGGFDAVLLLGPLYHLTARDDRVRALREGARVLRPSGVLVAAAVSRFASLLAGIAEGLLDDPAYRAIVEADLRDGQHRNPTERDYFTTAFFHHPDELRGELGEAGLEIEAIVGVEGPGWLLPDLGRRWADPRRRAELLDAARAIEAEPALLGLHAHLLGAARRPAPSGSGETARPPGTGHTIRGPQCTT